MRFKTVRLMTICNGPKGIMFTNDEFGLLQMISEIDVEWCASEDAGSRRRVDYEILHWLERE